MILYTLRAFNDLYQSANYLERPNPVTGDQLGANDRQPCTPAVAIILVAENAERFSNFEKWNRGEADQINPPGQPWSRHDFWKAASPSSALL
jgi:hypothetical protein